jgi:hypothetical protein
MRRRDIPLEEFSEEEEDAGLAEMALERLREIERSGEKPMTFEEFLISVGEDPDEDEDD